MKKPIITLVLCLAGFLASINVSSGKANALKFALPQSWSYTYPTPCGPITVTFTSSAPGGPTIQEYADTYSQGQQIATDACGQGPYNPPLP